MRREVFCRAACAGMVQRGSRNRYHAVSGLAYVVY
jgi:hypothetical protein